jgi:hypothetical protein
MRGISKKRYLTIIKRLRYTDLVIEDFTRDVKNWGKAGLDYGIFGMVYVLIFVVLVVVAGLGIFAGKKLSDRKDAKNAGETGNVEETK